MTPPNEIPGIDGTTEVANIAEVTTDSILGQPQEPPVIVTEDEFIAKQQEMTNEEYAPVAEGKEPNVKLAGIGRAVNPGPLIIGRLKLQLPDVATQKAGFYTPHAGELVSQYRQYKFVQTKGTKNTQNVKIS